MPSSRRNLIGSMNVTRAVLPVMRKQCSGHVVTITSTAGSSAARARPVRRVLPPRLQVLGWHEDGLSLPRGTVPLAGSIAYGNQAFRWGASAYGLQFHVEVRSGDLRRVCSREPAPPGTDSPKSSVLAPALDRTMRTLVERWLMLVSAAAAMRGRTQIAA
jgi:GMP synthase-like glutamine amidotransferase